MVVFNYSDLRIAFYSVDWVFEPFFHATSRSACTRS